MEVSAVLVKRLHSKFHALSFLRFRVIVFSSGHNLENRELSTPYICTTHLYISSSTPFSIIWCIPKLEENYHCDKNKNHIDTKYQESSLIFFRFIEFTYTHRQTRRYNSKNWTSKSSITYKFIKISWSIILTIPTLYILSMYSRRKYTRWYIFR